MIACTDCRRSGVVACPICSGDGYVKQLRQSGDLQYGGCPVCDGKKSMRCDSCGGIGWLGADNAPPWPVDRETPDGDRAEGSWDYEIRGRAAVERLLAWD